MDHTQYTTNEAERKPGKHLTAEDCGAIQAMKQLGHSNRAIARYLHCSPATISNELRRGTPPRTGPGYSAKRGEAVYKANRRRSHKLHRIDKCTSFVQWVVTQVRSEKWSIDACVGCARKNKLFPGNETVCTKTLYNELWTGNLSLNVPELPEAIKRKKSAKGKEHRRKCYGTSIDERPEIVDSRTECGHWKGDTAVGKRKGKESVILTLPEKKSQNYIAIRSPGKTSEAVNAAMERLYEEFGEKFSQSFKTMTVDNGPEFTAFNQIEKYGTKVCFAHPYTSWERAQNERHNSLLRRYVPKGVSVENFSDEEILRAADALNSLPRKIPLGTVLRKNYSKHSLTLFAQPERLRKSQFWLNLTLQPKLRL